MDLNYHGGLEKSCIAEVCDSRPSVKQRLERQKSELENQLQCVNDALEALNANPEVMKVLELVSRV